MYSMVLMAAVATSGDAASFHWKSAGCHGCSGAPVVVRHAPITYSVGCYGSSHAVGSCTGCSGCTGYTTYSHSCFGASCFGSSASCMGCCGGNGCCGGFGWYTPARVAPLMPMGEPKPAAAPKAPASIEIELPSDAALIVDGQAVPGTGAKRTFSTPELPEGKTYYYVMTAEVTLNGTVHKEELNVVVRGGEQVKQSFGQLLAKAKGSTTTDVAKK